MNEISRHNVATGGTRDWRKAMSNHVAYALLVYTALQIFMTVKALKEGTPSIFPYFALIFLVAAIIPACRWFEKRWSGMSESEAVDPGHASAFRRDITGLWLMAIGLPLLFTGSFKLFMA